MSHTSIPCSSATFLGYRRESHYSDRVSAQTSLESREVQAFVSFIRAHASVVRGLDRELVADHGLTINDYEVLLRLARAPDRMMRRVDLAQQVLLTPSGITRLLDGLQRSRLRREGRLRQRRARRLREADRRRAAEAQDRDGRPRREHLRAVRRALQRRGARHAVRLPRAAGAEGRQLDYGRHAVLPAPRRRSAEAPRPVPRQRHAAHRGGHGPRGLLGERVDPLPPHVAVPRREARRLRADRAQGVGARPAQAAAPEDVGRRRRRRCAQRPAAADVERRRRDLALPPDRDHGRLLPQRRGRRGDLRPRGLGDGRVDLRRASVQARRLRRHSARHDVPRSCRTTASSATSSSSHRA